MSKMYLIGLMFLSLPAFASDWQMTYHNSKQAAMFIDKEGLNETTGNMKKFWTLYAPKVSMNEPGAGYAYSKKLHLINCTDRTAAIAQVIYYDENQVAHDSIVEDRALHDIIPDSENNYLWQYACKPDQQASLATPAGNGMDDYLKDQARFTRENLRQMKRVNGQ